jgi:hypothetical protein
MLSAAGDAARMEWDGVALKAWAGIAAVITSGVLLLAGVGLRVMAPSLDPNPPIPGETKRDQMGALFSLSCSKIVRFGTRADAPTRPPSNFKIGACASATFPIVRLPIG